MNTQNTNLDEIIREERKEYFRNWRAQNADKVKEHNANYWRKRVERKLQAEANKKAGE